MNRDYDLFEQFDDGSTIWRCNIVGHDAAVTKLKELAAKTRNEVFVMHLPTKAVIARLKFPNSEPAEQ